MDPSFVSSQQRSETDPFHSEIHLCFETSLSFPPGKIRSEEDCNTLDTESDSEPKMPNLLIPRLLPMKTRQTPKFTLVLDLDETLVHSETIPLPIVDYTFQLTLDQGSFRIYVAYRPGLFDFLEVMCGLFEVVIFTASIQKYAEQVLKAIDPNAKLKYRFYRESCVEIKGALVKDLRVLGRDLGQVAIIDNSEHSYLCQPMNGILIPSWFHDRQDKALQRLVPMLLQMSQAEDVREFLKSYKY